MVLFLPDTPAPAEEFGEVLTRRWVVEAILDLTGYVQSPDLAGMVLIEPSAGRGAFLLPAAERLIAAARPASSEFKALAPCIRAYELQETNVEHCRAQIESLLIGAGCPGSDAQDLASEWIRHGDYLLEPDLPIADVIVGNPPYIRIEDIPPATQSLYRSLYATMRGRADIYVGFIERSLRALAGGGRLGFICADRWMHNQYGSALRSLIGSGYSVDAVWKMHDVDAFETTVSAYPAITVISNRAQGSSVVAEATASFDACSARELAAWSTTSSSESVTTGSYAAYRLPHWFTGTQLWPTGSPARLALIEHLNDNFGPLHDPSNGTRVGIGVATGADRVFITRDAAAAEADRMLPLSMVGDLGSGKFSWSGHYLVNPWEEDGTLVDLSRYPRMQRYLQSSAEILAGRHVARRNAAAWYRTIDKVTASLTTKPKLLLQDMRTTIHPVLETGGHYPHHNLYYVTSESWDMEVLGGLLLSAVAQAFIEAYAVRMRGGTLRFQAQYLKQIRIPDPAQLPEAQQEALREAFRAHDQRAATRAAIEAYGIHDHRHLLGEAP
ncbi:Eco57I restriction-modification methylase domain-containing protein [Lolliginicoccus levis]|uniref:Eco57I restriction-modification methylase domain-containing protein n=1 Tax=Lolliginicoccus levis TaxID=2919542 RepID=UPI00241E0F43|nr:Eco57I restriction-modification methylase domain-containing protein [Lolliginicoccus levis]